MDLRQQPDQRPGLGRGLAARAVRHLDLLAGHHGPREQAVAQDRWRRGHPLHRRTYRNAERLMTTNTAAIAALPLAHDAVAVRRWDDEAKDPSVAPPAFGHFEALLTALLH